MNGDDWKLTETMRGKVFRYRLMSLLLILFMVIMGVRVEGNHADSRLTHSAFGSESFQKPGMGQEPVVYRDKSAFHQIESFTAVRSSVKTAVGTRLALWLTVLPFPGACSFQYLTGENSIILQRACKNQYRYRTLKYIHQTDGEKA